MQGKEITLSTGETAFVTSVPQKMTDVLRAKYPEPTVPIKEDKEHPTATGEPVFYEDPNDPEYRRAFAEAEDQRMLKWAEGQILFGLPQVEVPADWEPPIEEIQWLDPDWEPRQGEQGRKLDYVEWDLLRNPSDLTLFFVTINELAGVSEEAADAVEETFPGGLEGESD